MRSSIVAVMLLIISSCNSFDQELATKDFKNKYAGYEIVEIKDYECDGTLGECWYVAFKYKKPDSDSVLQKTFQYWFKDEMWVFKQEFVGSGN